MTVCVTIMHAFVCTHQIAILEFPTSFHKLRIYTSMYYILLKYMFYF